MCIDRTMLTTVTIPTSVCGSNPRWPPSLINFKGLLLHPTLLVLNSEVYPGTNTLILLGDGSRNTWICFWCPVTFLNPSVQLWSEEWVFSLPWSLQPCLSLVPSQILDHLPVMTLIWWYSHMLISRIGKVSLQFFLSYIVSHLIN